MVSLYFQVEPPPPLLSRPWTREQLNSGGSGEESTDSTSDLPQATTHPTTPSTHVPSPYLELRQQKVKLRPLVYMTFNIKK